MRSALNKVDGVGAIEVGSIDKQTQCAIVKVQGTATAAELMAAFEGTQYSAKEN